MINITITELKTLRIEKFPEEKNSLTAKLNQMTVECIAEQAKIAESSLKKEEDPAEAIVKAYIAMDKSMMKVMDEHIERVRRSSERNKELCRKLAMKKEIEKRALMRKEYFDQAAEKVEEQRKFLQMRG